MGFSFAYKPLALGRLYSLQESIEHQYVLTGENCVLHRLRPNPSDRTDLVCFYAVLQDYALRKAASEPCRCCDIYLGRIGRAQPMGLEDRWSPKVSVFADPGNGNGLCIQPIGLRHIFVYAIQTMRHSRKSAAFGKTQDSGTGDPQAFGLRRSKQAIIAYGFIKYGIV